MNHLEEKYSSAVFVKGGHEKMGNDGETLLSDILDNAYVVINFANGVRALLDLCMFAEASTNQEEIVAVGSKGKVEAFIFVINLFDLGGTDNLIKKNFNVENLIEFSGH